MSPFNRHLALAAVGLVGMAGFARAGEILQFSQLPDTDGAEFVFDGSNLNEGPGAIGNGDGNSLPTAQAAGGLSLTTTFTPPFFVPAAGQDLSDSRVFYDASLLLSGFAVSAPASNIGGILNQPLGTGDFTITDTNGVVLLAGHADNAIITGTSNVASTLSATVTYDSGTFLSYIGGPGVQGSFSFSLLLTDGSPDLSIASGGYLAPFSANGTGDFSVASVPVPAASLGGLGLIGVLGLAQARRRRQITA